MKRLFSLAGLMALALLLVSRSVMGWEFFVSPPTYAEGPIKWYETDNDPNTERVTVQVDSGGLNTIGDVDNGVLATIGALEAWNSPSLDRLISGVAVANPTFNVLDGVSTLHFSDPTPNNDCSSPCLALTIVTHYDMGDVQNGVVDIQRCNGTDYLPYYDVSIVTNNTDFAWTSESEDPQLNGCFNEYYIEAVMSHEAGHLLGLGHEDDVFPAQALMYPSIAACDQKALQYDDLRGRDVIYDCDGQCSAQSPPNAAFSHSTNGLSASFMDQSSDSDGSVTGWQWDFGDTNASTAQNPNHSYASAGTYAVKLTVTDDSGLTDEVTQNVTVSSPSGISLSANGYKLKGVQHVDLSWSGAESSVQIFRNGALIRTTLDTDPDTYTDNLNTKGGGVTYSYEVCNTGSSDCSDPVNVTF